MYCMIHSQNLFYYLKFRHVQAYQHPIKTYLAMLWHIQDPVSLLHFQNPVIFRILAYLEHTIHSEHCQSIFWHIQNTVQHCHIENSVIFRTLPFSEFWHILNARHIHSESCLYRHIQAYSGIFNNDSLNTINFLFYFNLVYFSTKFKDMI